MGVQRSYLPSGGFKEYLYHQIGNMTIIDSGKGLSMSTNSLIPQAAN